MQVSNLKGQQLCGTLSSNQALYLETLLPIFLSSMWIHAESFVPQELQGQAVGQTELAEAHNPTPHNLEDSNYFLQDRGLAESYAVVLTSTLLVCLLCRAAFRVL